MPWALKKLKRVSYKIFSLVCVVALRQHDLKDSAHAFHARCGNGTVVPLNYFLQSAKPKPVPSYLSLAFSRVRF
jgi:hypothetical protein